MNQRPIRIVLVGGGHAHAVALARGLFEPAAGHHVTVLARDLLTPYSGMIPGVIAGLYRPDEAHIDLLRLARATGAEILAGAAMGVDVSSRCVLVDGRPPIPFDILSIDVGIVPAIDGIEGVEHATAIKPIAGFLVRLERLAQRVTLGQARRIAVVGGGAGGVEVALALRARFPAEAVSILLVTRGRLLPEHNDRVRRAISGTLASKAIELVADFDVAVIARDGLVAKDGRAVEADEVLLNTAAAAPDWFAQTGLALHHGFLVVDPFLRTSDHRIFASGDCAHMVEAPRPKAGVYAVRQGPILARTIKDLAFALQEGRAPRPSRYEPQGKVLALLSTGDGSAVASKGPLFAAGRWVWRWKDHIDRRFMRGLAELPRVPTREPWPNIVPPPTPADWPPGVSFGPGAPAAVSTVACVPRLVDDDYLQGRFAALAALAPLVAAGARAAHLDVSLTINTVNEREAEAREMAFRAGIDAELGPRGGRLGVLTRRPGSRDEAIIAARGEGRPETLRGLAGGKPGDLLVLTMPIGSGSLVAADRAGELSGADWLAFVAAATELRDGEAALAGAEACAAMALGDYGLGGAASLIAAAAGAAASLALAAIPVLAGAREEAWRLNEAAYPLAARAVGALAGAATTRALLFSPEVTGAILAAVPPDALDGLARHAEALMPIGVLVERIPGVDGAVLVKG